MSVEPLKIGQKFIKLDGKVKNKDIQKEILKKNIIMKIKLIIKTAHHIIIQTGHSINIINLMEMQPKLNNI